MEHFRSCFSYEGEESRDQNVSTNSEKAVLLLSGIRTGGSFTLLYSVVRRTFSMALWPSWLRDITLDVLTQSKIHFLRALLEKFQLLAEGIDGSLLHKFSIVVR